MNLYHLRYFVTLAHLEHYTKAAEILAITQPSLSHAIASLEKELGVKLFEKDGRNVALTKCGQAFLTDVEQALSMLDSSVNKLQMTGNGEGRAKIYRCIVRDVRLFVNTINRAVDTMLCAGINAETSRSESEDYIEYTVKIPKKEAYRKAPEKAEATA